MNELEGFVSFARNSLQELPIFELGYPRFDVELAIIALSSSSLKVIDQKELKKVYANYMLNIIINKSPQEFFAELMEKRNEFVKSKEAILLVELLALAKDVDNELLKEVVYQMMERITMSAIFFVLLLRDFFESLEQPSFYNSKGEIQ